MKKIFLILTLILLFISCNKQDLATVKTTIDGTSTLSSVGIKGKIINDGGCAIQSKGICLSSKILPTILDTVFRDASLKLEFKNEFKDLAPGKIYYARAFVVNKVGTAYGEVMKVATLVNIKTDSITKITSHSAVSGGTIVSNNTSNILSKGVCLSLKTMPTISDFKSVSSINSSSFTNELNDLAKNTTYYVRAYVVNEGGVSYGNERTFTTDAVSEPTVKTNLITSITSNSAIAEGEIVNDGGYQITSKGICWGVSSNPVVVNNQNTSYSYSQGNGVYNCNLNNLLVNTTYYVRAFAINSSGISYGDNVIFVTKLTDLPTITTNSISNITSNSALGEGEVLADGGFPIISRGLCWGSTINPTINNSNSIASTTSGLGVFTINMQNLTSQQTYFVRAYAINSKGVVYGENKTFTTSPILYPPTVNTYFNGTPCYSIGYTSAKCGGQIVTTGSSPVSDMGVCFGKTLNPTLTDSYVSNGAGSQGSYQTDLTNLSPNTLYYVRAYAVNTQGISYGQCYTFTTLSYSLPIVSTSSSSSITGNSVDLGGNVTSDGGTTVTARGICWSTTSNPNLASSITINGLGMGVFSSSLSGLLPNTTYYYRAYATNSVGTAYGNIMSFKTLSSPFVSTSSTSLVTLTGANSGGSISSDGGATVTARGICWSTTSNPTLASNITVNGLGVGSFTSILSNLNPNTTYYIRAYATNSIGTSYGNEISFTTLNYNLPSVTTNIISGITSLSASSGGVVTSDGGTTVISRGICWSTTINPTLASSLTSNGLGVGSFNSSLSGLTPNTTYYVRAYATNSVGTAYGATVTFKTSINIGDSYGGGVVAYILKSGDPGYVVGENHGIIAASSDQSTGIRWYNGAYTNTNASGTILGTGNSNTNKIVLSLGNGNYAAKLCYDLVLGGYSDWYLPSFSELNKLFESKAIIGGFDSSNMSYYWSSSEHTNYLAYNLKFLSSLNTGTTNWDYKDSQYFVRAIRSF